MLVEKLNRLDFHVIFTMLIDFFIIINWSFQVIQTELGGDKISKKLNK